MTNTHLRMQIIGLNLFGLKIIFNSLIGVFKMAVAQSYFFQVPNLTGFKKVGLKVQLKSLLVVAQLLMAKAFFL